MAEPSAWDTLGGEATVSLSIPSIDAPTLHERLRRDSRTIVLDVRTDDEFRDGFIPQAMHIPLHLLEDRVREQIPDLHAPVVIYCAHGIRSAQALRLMQKLGYGQLEHLDAGFAHWVTLKLPVDSRGAPGLANTSHSRYSRQILLEQVGNRGQRRLAQARVLLIGVGGLGSPAALYLAGAGVGTLGLVDADAVELSNLHRQIIHGNGSIGIAKVESARERIAQANPDVAVETYDARFVPGNAASIVERGWDVILDGADNFPTRYTLNDVATKYDVPVCHGSIDRFEGRVTTFVSPHGPCYRCLFPTPPRPGTIGSCAERGVLGVLPGVIGVLQATEALKIILGIGASLSGRLLTYDALALEFRELRYTRDATCPTCGTLRKGNAPS